MPRVCPITGKKTISGNNVSHANNRTRRKFHPNLQYKKLWVPSENRWISVRISTSAMRTITKNGIDAVIKDLRANGWVV